MIFASTIRETNNILLSVNCVFNYILNFVIKGIRPIGINQDECLFAYFSRKRGNVSNVFKGGSG